MPRPMISVTLDFASIEARIAKGERVTVRHIAEEKGVSPQIVRRALLAHYSAKVKFTRGRTGGIAISGGTPAATSTSAGPEVADPAATA
jgi:predicted transcriptional regulator